MLQDKLTRANLDYSEELYKAYLQDPSQVESSWRWFFQGLNQGLSQKTSVAGLNKRITNLSAFQLL